MNQKSLDKKIKYGEPCPECGLSWGHGNVKCSYPYPQEPKSSLDKNKIKECESCQHFGKDECDYIKCYKNNWCEWEEINKPKELNKDLRAFPMWFKTKELDWEKEFEIKYGRNSGRLTFYNEQKYYWNNKFYDEIQEFIKQTITQQRTELLEEIKNHTFIIPQGHITRGFKLDDKDLSFLKNTNLLNKKDE